jgi:capsular polysaccharide transport system ATP-binding protein
MIVLDGVSKRYRGTNRLVLDEISAIFRRRQHVAVIGARGSGKSTLLRLLCGKILPSHGTIKRDMSVSFPIGSMIRMMPKQTLRQALWFAASVHAVDPAEFTAFVARAAGLANELDRHAGHIGAQKIRTLNLLMAYGIPFECYLFDESLGFEKGPTANLVRGMFEQRSATSATILASRSRRALEQYAELNPDLYVLQQAKLIPCDSLREAMRAVRRSRDGRWASAKPEMEDEEEKAAENDVFG